MGNENRRQIGKRYEELAAGYLTAQGLHIIEQNYRSPHGEIDLIAFDRGYLVFIEVKYRKDGQMGDPAEAVGYEKQRHIRSAARRYLYDHRYGEETPCRFDVVAILGQQIRWFQNAF